MEIATNAVLLAMLMQASDVVEKLGLPLQTPLQQSNVWVFRVSAFPGLEETANLSCYLFYRGGYQFWHDNGRISSFSTPQAYDPAKVTRLTGEVRFSEAQCLAKAREAIWKLGYTNVVLLDRALVVRPPFEERRGTVPRYVFEWTRPGDYEGEQPWTVAEVEVNANRLTIERMNLISHVFWAEPWPVTFGQTNLPAPEPWPAPKPTELELKGVTKEYAMAWIRAALPPINEFCSKLGLGLPNPIRESDIVMGESSVSMLEGRPLVSLGLNSSHQVRFYKGHVGKIQTRDSYFNSPWRDEQFRKSVEYLEPIKYTKTDVAEKVRRLLVEKLKLPVEPHYLDRDPKFHLVPSRTATKGTRRYYFRWERPETTEEREQRELVSLFPEASVSADVDAVSCEIKLLIFWHPSFERLDPEVHPSPTNAAAAPRP